ncbi:hypothetical protein AAFF_G00360420 [Aldrovandia affinis]|uniref:Uncharacterized protein n=1 Tax=Aldrovandia affinis TaxID=143900 RepID=A0AAD7SIA8_9TELE|nr:hypothetical protein AAFF_G00360420 [Aldrovandia affinis]
MSHGYCVTFCSVPPSAPAAIRSRSGLPPQARWSEHSEAAKANRNLPTNPRFSRSTIASLYWNRGCDATAEIALPKGLQLEESGELAGPSSHRSRRRIHWAAVAKDPRCDGNGIGRQRRHCARPHPHATTTPRRCQLSLVPHASSRPQLPPTAHSPSRCVPGAFQRPASHCAGLCGPARLLCKAAV